MTNRVLRFKITWHCQMNTGHTLSAPVSETIIQLFCYFAKSINVHEIFILKRDKLLKRTLVTEIYLLVPSMEPRNNKWQRRNACKSRIFIKYMCLLESKVMFFVKSDLCLFWIGMLSYCKLILYGYILFKMLKPKQGCWSVYTVGMCDAELFWSFHLWLKWNVQESGGVEKLHPNPWDLEEALTSRKHSPEEIRYKVRNKRCGCDGYSAETALSL